MAREDDSRLREALENLDPAVSERIKASVFAAEMELAVGEQPLPTLDEALEQAAALDEAVESALRGSSDE